MLKLKKLHIAGHSIGIGRCFIIAEAGVNHNGSLDLALKMIDTAAGCGADAVKFQTFNPTLLASREASKANYQVETTGDDTSVREMLESLMLPSSAFEKIRDRCADNNIVFLSTPFDEESVDLLDNLAVPAWKISSGDLTNFPLLRHVCLKGKPVILSTGMATMDEVGAAVNWVRACGVADVIILQCVSNYPASPADANLRTMAEYARRFGVEVGYSDHTLGIAVPIAAAALGAAVIEKHLTLDQSMRGPDHRASLEPAEFKAMVAGIRMAEAALGDGIKKPIDSELEVRAAVRRSLYWRRDVVGNTMAVLEDFIALRPGGGISPTAIDRYIGRRLAHGVRSGTAVSESDFEYAK